MYKCDQNNCNYESKWKRNVVTHKMRKHDINVIWYNCNENNCDYKSKNKKDVDTHKIHSHNINVIWYNCNIDNCNTRCKNIGNLNKHKARIHNINEKWNYCNQNNCNYKTISTSDMNRHIKNTHNINVKWFICDQNGCDKKFKSNSELKSHKHGVHNINVKWFICDQNRCDKKFKFNNKLKRHKQTVHNINSNIYMCEFCNKEFKENNKLIRHKQSVHNINANKYECNQKECDFNTSRKDHLKAHIENVHDIGEHTCDFCLNNRNSSINYKDEQGEHKICRKCYNKITGKDSRVEKQWSDYLDKNFSTEFLISSDKRVMGDVCTRYRPDKLYACPGIILHKECDENQHKYGNGGYKCDEKRISDIYDEFPGNKYIVTRWNPDNYKFPKGYKKLNRNERLELDFYVTNKVLNNISKIQHQIFIIYMFYDKDNKRLSKNIPHTLFYNKNDVDNFFK